MVLCHTVRDGVVPKGLQHPDRPFIYCGESDEAQGFGKWLPEHLDDPSKKAPRKPRERFWVYRCWDGTDFPVRRKRTDTPGKEKWVGWETTFPEGRRQAEIAPFHWHETEQKRAAGELLFVVKGELKAEQLAAAGFASISILDPTERLVFELRRMQSQVVLAPDCDLADLDHWYRELSNQLPQASHLMPPLKGMNWRNPPKEGGLGVEDWLERSKPDAQTIAAGIVSTTWKSETEPNGGTKGFCSATKDLNSLKTEAKRILQDQQIESMHRLIHLRSFAEKLDTGFTYLELKQALWSARRAIHGTSTPHKGGSKLSRRKAPFFWEGVVMKEATTLFISLPKVGKTRLLCQFIARLIRGDSEFLGRKLTGPCPPVAIIGSDQDEGDWAECLHLAGLLDNNDTLNSRIVALYDKGCPLHLDDQGIETIADLAAKQPGVLILVDSYFSCTSQLGLKERDADFAGPLVDLQEAIAPHKATLVVIHHSGKAAANEEASLASRGTTALPSQSSWNVGLSRRLSTNPLAPQEKRITLKSEGRGGSPLELLIEQVDDGYNWISHGDAEDVAKQRIIEDLIDGLEPRQRDALEDLVEHWQHTGAGMTASAVADALGIDGSNPEARARETIDKLRKVRLVEQDGEKERKGTGRRKALWRPTASALQFFGLHQLESSIPSISSFSKTTSQKNDKDDKDDCCVYTRAWA
ncbi:AAA family ATPase [Synechococcus sp. YX-04-1]|uniref:AAA family ATPase n=1 Tax=Synechococcus sp. YX-04-1 TaxID=3062778 RepID=UPI0026E33DF9|nr:AAA family ATPase [Synechococcus sp. YX-04-1]MDO6353258.1 AAA family ATPase [Synechococcus sp. YX-04-1]